MQFCLYCGTLLTADTCALCGSGDPTPAQVYALLRAARAYVPPYGSSWQLYRALDVVLEGLVAPPQLVQWPEVR